MSDPTTDFAHSSTAQARRHSKALVLARFLWNRGINADELANSLPLTQSGKIDYSRLTPTQFTPGPEFRSSPEGGIED